MHNEQCDLPSHSNSAHQSGSSSCSDSDDNIYLSFMPPIAFSPPEYDSCFLKRYSTSNNTPVNFSSCLPQLSASYSIMPNVVPVMVR